MTGRTRTGLLLLSALAACAGRGASEQADTSRLAGGAGESATAGATSAVGRGAPTPATAGATADAPRGGGPAPARTSPSPAAGGAPSPAGPSGTPSAPGPAGGGAAVDTARGTAAVVGSLPFTRVVVRPGSGRPITVTGALAREIGTASGADVWVRGRRVDDRTIEVTSYAVRSVDGVPAVTGTLSADGDRLVLVSDDGRRHVIARPPVQLRDLLGSRVWVSGDLGTTITAYGVLRRRQ